MIRRGFLATLGLAVLGVPAALAAVFTGGRPVFHAPVVVGADGVTPVDSGVVVSRVLVTSDRRNTASVTVRNRQGRLVATLPPGGRAWAMVSRFNRIRLAAASGSQCVYLGGVA